MANGAHLRVQYLVDSEYHLQPRQSQHAEDLSGNHSRAFTVILRALGVVPHLFDLVMDSSDPKRLSQRPQSRVRSVVNSVLCELVGEDHWRKGVEPAEVHSHGLRHPWYRDQVQASRDEGGVLQAAGLEKIHALW